MPDWSRRHALQAAAAAGATAPAAVSAELARSAHDALLDGRRDLERTGGYPRDVDQALGRFAVARLYAEEVPDAVAAVVDALGEEE